MRDLYLLIVMTVLCHTVAAGVRVALSLYGLHLGESALSVGLIMGVYGVLPMVFSVGAGRLSDRIGAAKPMLLGAAGLGLGAALPWFWPTVPSLYLASGVVGCAFMFFNIAMQNVAGHIGKPEDRPRNLSLMALGFSFSIMAGPTLAGTAIDAFGHGTTFVIFALLPVIPVILLAFRIIRLPNALQQSSQTGKRRALDLLLDRKLQPIFVTSVLLSMSWELYTFAVPVYGSSIGLSPTAIGLIMAAFSAAILVIRFLLPWFAKRLDALKVICATLVYSAMIFALFPFTTSAWLLAAYSFLLGLAMGIPQPLVVMLLHSHVPAGRVGEAIGMRQASIYASQAFMPMLLGALGAALGLGPVFWLSALIFVGGGVYAKRGATAR